MQSLPSARQAICRTSLFIHLAAALLVASAIPGAAAGVKAGAPASAKITLAERLQILQQSYPEAITGIDDNKLLLKGGRSIVIDDGSRKSHFDKLKTADIEDMLSQIYPLGACDRGPPRRNSDPGRIRNEAFLRAVYGGSKSEARRALQNVTWFGSALRFAGPGGAAKALQRVHDDLKTLDRNDQKYFTQTNGTFVWRPIAGTKRLSVHSFGAAIDLNIDYADYWRWSGGTPGKVPRYKNKIPKAVVEVFERHGFIWGGKWYHFDTMHFEYRPEIIAIAKLHAERGCGQ